MNGRRGAAVLLLFAVLFMHGIQCSSVGDPANHSDADPTIALATSTGGGSQPASDLNTHAAAGPSVEAMPAAAPPATESGAVPTGEHDSAPHGTGHLWTVCLAVLAAGLAVLLAVLRAPLASRWLAARKGRLSRAIGGLSLPRRPDLHALCLLRI